MRLRPVWLALPAAAILGLHDIGAADESVPLNDLPEAVTKAIEGRFPNARLLSAEREDNSQRYEVKVDAGGRRHEVEVTADGQIVDVDDD